MNQEEYDYIQKLEHENAIQKVQNAQMALSNTTSSMFQPAGDINLIEWQLELDNILERIDHLLRGHILKFDNDGNLKWQEPKDKMYEIFNEYGVQEILRVLSMYLNRNTILSNYDEETISWKVYDLGMEISDLIFTKYNEMFAIPTFEQAFHEVYPHMKIIEFEGVMYAYDGENHYELGDEALKKVYEQMKKSTDPKIKLYPIVVKELVDTVHSSYLRALNGGERESLRTARTVTQTEPLQTLQSPMNIMQPKNKWFNPMSWGR